MSTTDAARYLGVHPKTLQRWVRDGAIAPSWTTPGGHHRWRLSDLAAIREQIRRDPPSRERLG